MTDRPTQLARKYRSAYYRDGYAAGLEGALRVIEDANFGDDICLHSIIRDIRALKPE